MKTHMINGSPEFNSKEQIKSESKFKRTYLWLKFILILCLFLATLVLAALSPLFNIDHIEVYGNRHYESRDIVDATGITVGSNGFKTIGSSLTNIFTLRYGNAEQSVLKYYPYVKDVKVRYIIPGKVRIEITERDPIAVVPYLGTSLIIDNEGYVLGTVKSTEKHNLPVVKGLRFEDFELGQALKVDNRESLDQVINVMKAVNSSDKEDRFKIKNLIKFIDASDKNRVCLFIDSRIVVNLGDLKDLDYRIRVLKQLFLKNFKKEDKGFLDFTTGENPVFMPDNQ